MKGQEDRGQVQLRVANVKSNDATLSTGHKQFGREGKGSHGVVVSASVSQYRKGKKLLTNSQYRQWQCVPVRAAFADLVSTR